MTDLPLLTDEELAVLTPEELDAYHDLLEADAREWRLTPRQQAADDLADKVDELMFGGAAGGGKSEFDIYHANKWSKKIPGHRTLILRSSFPELRRTLIARSLLKLSNPGISDVMGVPAHYKVGDKEWHYANGSVIEFGFCVAGDTPIRMGDGTYRPMAEVRVGDYVDTLEGPRRVTRHFHVGVKPSVRMTLPSGAAVVASLSHAVLAADGRWLPPCDLADTPSRVPRVAASSRSSRASGRGSRRPGGATRPGRRREARVLRTPLGSVLLPASGAWSGDERSGRTAPARSTRGRPLPPSWSALVGLHGPAARSTEAPESPDDRGAPARATRACGAPGCRDGCSTCTRRDGGRSLPVRGDGRARTPSRAGAGTCAPTSTRADGPTRTPPRSPEGAPSYCHPYTKEDRPLAVDVLPASASIDLVGDADLWDMTVEGANHYVSYGGMVHRNCETFEDVRQYLSAEYELLIIDESTDFTWEQIELLRSRLRTSKKKRALGCRPHMILSTNPGGVGHAEHKARYVTSTMGGQKVAVVRDNPADPLSERTVAFVPSKVSDNPHMDPAYERNLRSLSDPVKRAQYLEGSWDVFEGQFFAEYDRSLHEIDEQQIPPTWPRIRAIDFGTAAPFCCLWIAYDYDGNAYVYRELYEVGLTATEQAKRIIAATGKEKIEYTVADPSIWARTGTGVSIAQVYREAGLNVRKAMNARVDGWNRVREYLRGTDDPKDMHFGSYVRIVAKACPNLCRTLPDLPRDRNKQDDLDTNAEDHAADALRYGLMSRARKAKRPPEDRYGGEPRAFDDIEDVLKRREKGQHPILGKL